MKNIYTTLSIIALSLLFLEFTFCFITKKKYFSFEDTVASLGTAIINQCMNLVVLWLVIKSYGYLYLNYKIFQIEENFVTFLALLVAIDFLFYWFHRAGHSINILWAAHSPHHTSEEMNLMVGLRASLTQRIFSFIMYWPLTILGFSPEMIYATTGIHLLLGFWHHTRLIGNLGWFEKFFNTPSHHRVHHGTNPQYLDKNFAELFIIWDRIFGTFAQEKEPVCYGILRPLNSWSPLKINFHFWVMLFQDMCETPKFFDKIKLWFMPLGWRPPGVSHREPVKGYTLKEQVKYKAKPFKNSYLLLIVGAVYALFVMYEVINLQNIYSLPDRLSLSLLLLALVLVWSYLLESASSRFLFVSFFILQVKAIHIFFMNQSSLLFNISIFHCLLLIIFYFSYQSNQEDEGYLHTREL